MALSSWLSAVRARCVGNSDGARRRNRADRIGSVELSEPRCLLSVTVLVFGTSVEITADADDTVIVESLAGNLQVRDANGPLTSFGPIGSAAIESLTITGSDSDNVIDLSGVTAANFLALTSISVETNDGADLITGSPDLPNQLNGEDGQDTLIGGSANDTLDGHDGDDSITAGAGDDSVIAGDGQDTVTGGTGNDTVDAGYGADLVNAEAGNDSLLGSNGEDTLNGGTGNDTLNGDGGTDQLNGDDGDDRILGGDLNDSISGGTGNDTVDGQAGNDTITGDDGDDSLLGGVGHDSLLGNTGNDSLNGNAGDDTLVGDNGNDLMIGGSGNDSMNGSSNDDTLNGQGGNDTLLGGGDTDRMDGGTGNDLIDSARPTTATIAITDVSIIEGNNATTNLVFTMTLSAVTASVVTVTVSTADGTALTGLDYTSLNNLSVTFIPGTLTQTVNVPVSGDTSNEVDETVRLILSNPANALLQNHEAIGTIVNDDAAPNALFVSTFDGRLLSVNPSTGATALVGNMGVFGIHDIVSNGPGSLIGYAETSPRLFATNPATAASSIVTSVTGIPNPNLEGDAAFDPTTNSLFYVHSTNQRGNPHLFRIDPATGVGSDLGDLLAGGTTLAGINDILTMDYLAFANGLLYCVIAGDISGPNTAFNDSLLTIDPATRVATRIGGLGVDLTTFGVLGGGLEFDAAGNRLLLLEGATGNLYQVNVTTGLASLIGNTGVQPVGNGEATGLAQVSIPATAPRNIFVNDVRLAEVDLGTTTANFQVTVGPGSGNVTVNFATVDGTAAIGQDYVMTSGSLTFGPAGGTQLVTVTVNGDLNPEVDETLFLQLFNATGAALADGSGTATIVNDDGFPAGSTLVGGGGNDTLLGGLANDFMNGSDGNDSILGLAGNDSILGGAGADTINGGEDDDTVQGQGGNDLLDGGEGDDQLQWFGLSDGDDTLLNGAGFDSVLASGTNAANTFTIGQTATNQLFIDEGGATLVVHSALSNVTVNLLGGVDTVTIGSLTNVQPMVLSVNGGDGNDILSALGVSTGAVRLRLNGDAGDDSLTGSTNDDTLDGGDGVDTGLGGLGNDTLLGGADVDRLNGQEGDDNILGGDGNDVLRGFTGNDSISGDAGDDTVLAGDGNDTASGGAGSDSLMGEIGNDSLRGDSSNDTLNGGDGHDTLDGGTEADSITGDLGDDSIRGGHGADTIDAGDGNDSVNGGDGNDSLTGGLGNDGLNAGDGNDTVNGGFGNDSILGGDGADILLGGAGIDTLLGGDGNDTINGQSGTDIIATGEGTDINNDVTFTLDESFAFPANVLAALA